MRPKAEITIEEILRLKGLGWSLQRIANHGGVSRSTVRNRLKRDRPAKDPAVMEFAGRLEQMAGEAPNEFCGREIRRVVHVLRTKAALRPAALKELVLQNLEPGVWRDGRDIADELGLPLAWVQDLLDDLVAEAIVRRVSPGGVRNRGRRQKYFYLKIS